MATSKDNPKYELTNIKKIYTLPKKPYKKDQKTNNKVLIPFERIDYSLYRDAANCAVFITSINRILVWIHALGVLLVKEKGGNHNINVNWNDTKSNDTIEKTEFEFHSTESLGDYEGDTLLYKVIVYLTTGKIMIQGKGYRAWCENQFQKTLKFFDNCIQNPNQTDVNNDAN